MRLASLILWQLAAIGFENVCATPVLEPRAPSSHDGCAALEKKYPKLTFFPGEANYTTEATGMLFHMR